MDTILNKLEGLARIFIDPVVLRWILIILGIFVLIFIIYQVYKKYRQKKTEPAPPAPEEADKPSPKPQPQSKETETLLKKDFSDILKKLRAHVVGRNLRSQVAGRNYLHQIPWFMMIGESHSGKSTLLAKTGLKLFFLDELVPASRGCGGWFFDQGIVLEVKGKYVLPADSMGSDNTHSNQKNQSDDEGWLNLLGLLRRYRSNCPIDGIILTIPCDDLVDSQSQTELLTKKADSLYHKLWKTQKEIGIRFPIYILITKCDKLQGFTSFCSILPEQLRQNIFGWSNPDLHADYEPNLPGKIFQKLYQDLNTLQLELVTANSKIPETDNFLLFPHQFRLLFKQLQIYLDNIFQPSVYHEAFFLRGIYFCGDPDAQGNTQIFSPQSSVTSDQLDYELRHQQTLQHQPTRLFFLEHFFKNKLFKEADIASPVTEFLYRQKMILRRNQTLVALAAVGIGIGQWWAFNTITQDQAPLLKVLDTVYKDLGQLRDVKTPSFESFSSGYQDVREAETLNEIRFMGAENLLKGLSEIKNDYLFSIFLPASWTSDINDKVIACLALGYDNFILIWMERGLHNQAHKLAFLNLDRDKDLEIKQELIYRSQGRSNNENFKLLSGFIIEFKELQDNINLYNKIVNNAASNINNIDENAIKEINSLVQNIGRYLTTSDLKHKGLNLDLISPSLYQKILSYQHNYDNVENIEEFPLATEYAPAARQRIKLLTESWLNQLLTENRLLKDVRTLAKELDDLEQTRIKNSSQWLEDLLNTLKIMDRIEKYLGNSEWYWVSKYKYEFSEPNFSILLSNLVTNSLLQNLSKNLKHYADDNFQKFRQQLLEPQYSLTGAPILTEEIVVQKTPITPVEEPVVKEGQDQKLPAPPPLESINKEEIHLILSDTLIDLKQTLTSFREKKFMVAKGKGELNPRLFPERTISLQEAISLADSFHQYIKDDLPQVNPAIQSVLRDAGQVRLYDNMIYLIAQAQQPEIKGYNYQNYTTGGSNYSKVFQIGERLEERIRKDVFTFSTTVPLLEQILNETTQLSKQRGIEDDQNIRTLYQLMRTQAENLLDQVDKRLEEQLYTPTNTFEKWYGDGKQSLLEMAFEIRDQEEAEYYLSLQRERVKTLANYAQPLVDFLLKNQWKDSQKELKWKRILNSLNEYFDDKTTDNSLRFLETYIRFELDKITLDNCLTETRARSSGDYFLQKYKELQEALNQRCRYLIEEQKHLVNKKIYDDYRMIQDHFNQKLAGRFPFAALLMEKNHLDEEVDPKAIRDFFNIYDLYSRDLKESLKYNNVFGASKKLAIIFLEQIEKVRYFFQHLLEQPEEPWRWQEEPLFDLVVEFRVNKTEEKGANQIIDWTIELTDQVFKYPLDELEGYKGHWRLGEPIQVSLRWARNSNFRPSQDDDRSEGVMTLTASEVIQRQGINEAKDIARFKYSSFWSLLELLQRQGVLRRKPEAQNTLKFLVPVKKLLPHRQLSASAQDNDDSSIELGSNQVNNEANEDGYYWVFFNGTLTRRKVASEPVEQRQSVEDKSPALMPYQEQYHEQFEEQVEPAVVFLSFTLFRKLSDETEESLIVPEFPYLAPDLDYQPPPRFNSTVWR